VQAIFLFRQTPPRHRPKAFSLTANSSPMHLNTCFARVCPLFLPLFHLLIIIFSRLSRRRSHPSRLPLPFHISYQEKPPSSWLIYWRIPASLSISEDIIQLIMNSRKFLSRVSPILSTFFSGLPGSSGRFQAEASSAFQPPSESASAYAVSFSFFRRASSRSSKSRHEGPL